MTERTRHGEEEILADADAGRLLAHDLGQVEGDPG
jgi:hypothetical protein